MIGARSRGLAVMVIALAGCAVFDGPDDIAEDACRDSRDSRSAACVEYLDQYFKGRVPSPKGRPMHAAKAPKQYRPDRFDCEMTLFGGDSTFGGDPSISEVVRYHTQMRRCLEEKHGWTFVPE
ncbi:MAG: hypothetical protein ACREOF_06205 [Gemmatimonadales bacterium]